MGCAVGLVDSMGHSMWRTRRRHTQFSIPWEVFRQGYLGEVGGVGGQQLLGFGRQFAWGR